MSQTQLINFDSSTSVSINTNANTNIDNSSSIPTMKDLMGLLKDQSKVICNLQRTIDNLNETIKNLNGKIEKMEADKISNSSNSSNGELPKTVHENVEAPKCQDVIEDVRIVDKEVSKVNIVTSNLISNLNSNSKSAHETVHENIDKIKYSWFNDSFDSYKIKCKNLFL